MNLIQTSIDKLDSLQRKSHLVAFSYAVIKKYGDDQAGYQAALLTYYAFLSLFPLLLVVTTLTQLIASSHPHLQMSIINATTSYFPVLGSQLSNHVHSLHRNGVALAVGILFTFYGARGVADAFRSGVNHIWQIPRSQRDGFPKSAIKSVVIILVGGIGFIVASISAGLAAGVGHELVFRGVSILIDVFILFWVFNWLINISLPEHISLQDTRAGALSAAIGLVIMQTIGGYVLSRELKSLDALYSYFAIALGLLFWIYLQAQVLCYSIEISAVHAQKLWPRSLSGHSLTAADTKIVSLRSKENN
jgi:membrane protein